MAQQMYEQRLGEEENLQPITKTLKIDKSLRMGLPDNCAYDVRVRGKVVPVRPGGSAEEMVQPDLRLEADVQCTEDATLGFTRRIKTEPMTRAQLEDLLQREGMISSAVGRDPCFYAPDFNLSNAGLNLRSVSYRCPVARLGKPA